MLCDKCGATAADGTAVCPECGEPMAPAVFVPVPAPEATVPTVPRSQRPAWLIPAIAVAVLLVIAAAAYFLWPTITGSAESAPAAAVVRMMDSFAAYDAQGILDNATHASMSTTDVAAFVKQAESAKKLAAGKPGLKDLKVLKTTYDAKDKNTAVVQVSAQWLTDQAKGTYTQRTETLTVILKDGKWQVRLFQ